MFKTFTAAWPGGRNSVMNYINGIISSFEIFSNEIM